MILIFSFDFNLDLANSLSCKYWLHVDPPFVTMLALELEVLSFVDDVALAVVPPKRVDRCSLPVIYIRE